MFVPEGRTGVGSLYGRRRGRTHWLGRDVSMATHDLEQAQGPMRRTLGPSAICTPVITMGRW